MQKKRWRKLGFLRRVLTCAIALISLVALFSAHLHLFFPPSRVSMLPDPYKLPTQHEIQYQKLSRERSWIQPHLSKAPLPALKLDGAPNRSLESNKLWKPPPNRDFTPCVDPTSSYLAPQESRGYLLVHTNGGLNQMRAGICDMVAVARIINATLVVPELDKRSFWQDTSNFSDVFDEDYFITALANDVKIIRKLPKELMTATRAVKHFRSWSGIDYYEQEIASLWDDYQVIRAAKSDSRLANNNLPPDIQKLRCRACYEALRFSPRIEAMGKLLVDRMRSYGPYIALHLRYEKDMLAFSGCTHDLSIEEANELTAIRENTSYWKVKDIDSTEQRAKGYCPLTPKEVGIFLRALGFPPTTPIYIAAGEIYGGDSRMADITSIFPILMKKEKLATVEELDPFINHASQMAALDYIVSVESDIFIPSYSGNMARAVEGHRRFLGHRKTISPDRKLLVRIFDKIANGTMKEGKKLSSRIIEMHKRRQGSPRKRKGPITGTKGTDRFRSEEAFYVNPLPDCLCQKESTENENSTTAVIR
ncbi:putative GDP-fucose protein O-fucosyltransferase [Helianthus annuus]|uniref:O-fucosyltransferase family protein n=2 Tax=Helianthus annuus TaxID=4232 RepID=A0A251VF89_HELAN|nr:O-fucosyltransferase 7 isoform X1 [Helianthus annuus]KAF5818572.1 putative GDP-fucose protein O-fucosyltransferase [Helianthus annuus]KAJ0604834.1 putative GDP-fucose protein O-fucosyltransferase [Helianthus annuus]KAJ0615452.1 putative GDP-fucose protein O-fucosyltransferase [Helianthus annuus]KAJ0618849.1 putative GDP-fucose protein O-fucosyltransferase [Helianthus annuus]KAJ0777307.1 putative GDP-fucose protein O-fucosyltransferase [Helianthus annuus]